MLNSEAYNYYKLKATDELKMLPESLVECEYDFIFNECIVYNEDELPGIFSGFMEFIVLIMMIGSQTVLLAFMLIRLFPNTFDNHYKFDVEDLENEDEIIYEYRYIDELEDKLNKQERSNCCSNMPEECDNNDEENWEYTNDDEDNLIQCECTLHPPAPMTDDMKKHLSTKVLTETTPDGDVIMHYNYDQDIPERSSFYYYSNNRNIPFKYLDTVARKYVCTYDCVELYLYLKEEIEKEVDKIKAEKERELKLKEDNANAEKNKTNDVFATFKNYKNTSNSSQNTKRSLLVPKNRYTRMGTIDDYNRKLTVPSVSEKKLEVKNISFAEFKKMSQAQ
jgi:hypothetical protein